jgi:hypothetical protein
VQGVQMSCLAGRDLTDYDYMSVSKEGFLSISVKLMISLTRLTNEVDSSIEWLKRRLSEYRLTENDMGDIVEDFDEVGK